VTASESSKGSYATLTATTRHQFTPSVSANTAHLKGTSDNISVKLGLYTVIACNYHMYVYCTYCNCLHSAAAALTMNMSRTCIHRTVKTACVHSINGGGGTVRAHGKHIP